MPYSYCKMREKRKELPIRYEEGRTRGKINVSYTFYMIEVVPSFSLSFSQNILLVVRENKEYIYIYTCELSSAALRCVRPSCR